MAYIGSFPADKTSGAKPRDEFTGDGSTVNFTLSQEVPGGFESNVLVIVDNVIQQPVESYTIGGDNLTLQFSEAPAASAVVYVLHQGNATYQMIPVVGSVTPDKLSENLRNFTVDTFTGDGSTVAYTLTATPASANSILVIVDGIVQTKTTNYTLASTTLTFTDAPDSSAAITVIHLGFSTVSRTAVPDGSITTAKIADNAITSAKLGFDVIVAEDIAANAITVSELQNGAVTPAKLSTGGLYWDTSSNVGIGTTSPAVPLAVYKASDSAINIQNSTSGVTNVDGLQLLLSGANGYVWNYESGANIFGTANTERGRFTAGGYFKASDNGTYNNVSGSNHEFYNSANAETLIVRNANASFASEALIVSADRNTTNNSYYFLRLNVPGVANRLLIADSGSISTAGSVQLGDAGVPPTSGVGIKFPATQSASTDPNTLDDYEEGTWTPAVWGGGNISSAAGRYIKIGKQVYVSWDVQYGSTGNGDAAGFQNLPFTVFNANSAQGCTTISYNDYGSGFVGLAIANSTRVVYYNLSGTTLQNANFSLKRVMGGAVYEVA